MANKNNNIKEETRKIPNKNYVILAIIFAISIGVIFFFRNWYISYEDYEKTIPILNGVISEVRYNEVYNYIDDNQSVIIYMGVADDEDCREIEVELKKLIEDKHLKEKIVYFNITDVKNKDLLLKEFNDRYATNLRINAYPAIILFEDGKITEFRSKTANKNLSINEIKLLFNEYDVYGE